MKKTPNCLIVFLMVLISPAIHPACAELFHMPVLSGSAPSGIAWSDIATGTNLVIRSSGTNNGAPGAVAYYDVNTGELQIDPKGWTISLINFTYTILTNNPSITNAGPLVYPWGASPTSLIVSPTNGEPRRLPAGTWTLITASPSRLAGTVSLVRVPTLATSGDAGNIASVSGWFDQPWSFGVIMTNADVLSYNSMTNFKVFGVSGNANANILGYGNYRSVFQYTVDGVTGNQVGPIIPYESGPLASVFPSNGPYSGGNSLVVTNGLFGDGSDITNVTIGGSAAALTSQGTN